MQASRPAEQSTVFLSGRSKSRAPVVLQRRGAGFGYLPVLIRNIGRATAPTLQRPPNGVTHVPLGLHLIKAQGGLPYQCQYPSLALGDIM